MKPTTRGTLAAVVTGVAVAVGATATPAAATGTVPVPVPLDGVAKSLHTEVPGIGLELPLLVPGVPETPRYVQGRLIPEHALPRVPMNGVLPGADLRLPLPHALGPGFDHVGADLPASDLRALTPGLELDAPLSAPDPQHYGMPNLKMPEAGVLGPVLQTVVGGDLGAGPGR
ncbi:hypothetical protein [Streptomyces humi]|uniref:hypothetical protein n=1 Tax=Streptomyces humi TaxID=1428620 RepID=UPI000628859F|nr:hypothetical protein [Streptomyces humi]